MPDIGTFSRRQKTLAVNIPHLGSQGPLHPLIDSKGIKVEGEGEWNARKHGCTTRRVWRKVHFGIDEETLEVRAVEVTSGDVGDATKLLDQIPSDQEIASVSATGLTTRACGTMPSLIAGPALLARCAGMPSRDDPSPPVRLSARRP